jgi:hypothetical protein
MDMSQVVTTVVLADTLFDDRAEEHRDVRDLVLPLLLCGSMGGTQQTSVAPQPVAGPGAPPPTVVTDNSGAMQTLLVLALLRGRRRSGSAA